MTVLETGEIGAQSGKSQLPPGRDARDLVPDVYREALQAVRDSIEGVRPSTALGVLVDRREPIEMLTIAGLIRTPIPQVEWTVEVLEEHGLCRTYDDEGIEMVELAREWDRPKGPAVPPSTST